jgi:23S rRNA (cytidine1920-2'-O)/16S rRNA (cytidine1409-2'-O)-methyltransferase
MRTLLKDGGQAVCLIKPQFEAGKENVGKKGVVRDKNVHIAVIEKIIGLIEENKFSLLGLDFSPVKGPEGNIEYLCHIKKTEEAQILCDVTATEVVEKSYEALKG